MTQRIKEAFDAVRAEDGLKQNTKEYLRRKAFSPIKRRAFIPKYAPLMAACLAICIIAGGTLVFTPVSAIVVDVNPSIELGINRFDKVVSVAAMNEDGRALADAVDIRFLNYADALERIVESDEVSGYVADGEQISITVVNNDGAKSEEMLSCINSRACLNSGFVRCYSGNREEAAKAREAGLSYGKYRAYLELKQLDSSVVPEDVQGLTMRQIRELIYEAGGDGATRGRGRGNGGMNRRKGAN